MKMNWIKIWSFFRNKKKIEDKKKVDDDCIQYIGGEYINICDSDVENTQTTIENIEDREIAKTKISEDIMAENNILDEIIEDNIQITEERVAGKKGRPSKRVMEEYERNIKMNHSSNTYKAYIAGIKFWNKVAKDRDRSIYTLEARDIEDALEKYANKTRIQRLAALRKLAKIYLRNDYPKLFLELQRIMIVTKHQEHIVQYLSEDEYKELKGKIVSGLNKKKKEYLWLGLFLFCGLRVSEIETIIIENEKFIKVTGKGDKQRLVPCPALLIEAIKNIKRDGYGGWKKSGKAIDQNLRRKGYLEQFHCHQLRHTYATNLYRRGLDLNIIKELLGHTTILTTQIYAKAKVDEGILEYIDI